MKLEVLEKGFTYHIYNRGINGTNLFMNDGNKLYFLKLMSKQLTDLCSIYAYCLMDNHFHILLKINADTETTTQKLSNFMNAYAKAFNKEQNRTGSLFEKHFRRIRIADDNYFRSLIIYIHMNPKHHLNIDFSKYRFSSYHSCISDKPTKIMRNEVLELFGGKENFAFIHDERNIYLEEKMMLE